MKKNNNKGFSLFEMVAVIAIVAIMMTIVAISIGTAGRNEVFRTSEKIESLLNQARVYALTKGSDEGYVSVAKTSSGYYAYVGNPDNIKAVGEDGSKFVSAEEVKKNGDKIGNANLDISFNGIIADDSVNQIHFKQSTGGLYPGSGNVVQVKNKKMKSAIIYIYPATGKTYTN